MSKASDPIAARIVRVASKAMILKIGLNQGRRSTYWESRATAVAVLRALSRGGTWEADILEAMADEIELPEEDGR